MSKRKQREVKNRDGTAKGISHCLEFNSLVAYVANLLTQLERAMTSLPHVDSHGHSPCPPDIIKELYARKEKLQQQVSSCLPRLSELLMALEKEVARCQSNLDRIRTDSGRLNLDETRNKYSEAEQAQELQLRRAKDNRDAIYVVLKKAEIVLSVSRRRRMPEFKQRKNDDPGNRRKAPRTSSNTHSTGQASYGLGSDLDSLLSADPTGFQRSRFGRY